MAIYTQVLNLGNTRLDDGRRILKSRLWNIIMMYNFTAIYIYIQVLRYERTWLNNEMRIWKSHLWNIYNWHIISWLDIIQALQIENTFCTKWVWLYIIYSSENTFELIIYYTSILNWKYLVHKMILI
jgi:hypothetical protein